MDNTHEIAASDQIESHLTEIARLGIPVDCFLADGRWLTGCRLVVESKDKLKIHPPSSDSVSPGDVEITYSYGETVFGFTSSFNTFIDDHFQQPVMELSFPSLIASMDRRRHFRVEPSPDDPVRLQCSLSNGTGFDALASDIGLQGLAFHMIESAFLPVTGDHLKLTLHTPRLKEITATATIKNTLKALDLVRFGVEFTEVSDRGQPRLMEYLISRERQIRREGVGSAGAEKALVFVIDEREARGQYNFLSQRFKVSHSDAFNVIGKLLASAPDAIVFNPGLPGAEMVLKILMKHQDLKGTPLIEVQKTTRRASGNFFKSLLFPLNEAIVLDTLDRAIKLRRLSRMLREGEFVGPLKTGIAILLIDDSSVLKPHDMEVLQAFQCHVRVIDNLKLLYDSFAWSTPDVIVVDENTKEIDALAIGRLLSMNRELKTVPRMLLSEKRCGDDRIRSELFFSVLTKPFTAKQLLGTVSDLLSRVPA